MKSNITPFLWFNNQAEEAANFYVSTFKNSAMGNVSPGPDGAVMLVTFSIDGQDFMALNGGPLFTFSQATSFMVHCETQEEVDHLWDTLSVGGEIQQCGWLIDRFGVTWQIIPNALGRLMGDPNPTKSMAVVTAMLEMKKIDIAGLQQAYDSA